MGRVDTNPGNDVGDSDRSKASFGTPSSSDEGDSWSSRRKSLLRRKTPSLEGTSISPTQVRQRTKRIKKSGAREDTEQAENHSSPLCGNKAEENQAPGSSSTQSQQQAPLTSSTTSSAPESERDVVRSSKDDRAEQSNSDEQDNFQNTHPPGRHVLVHQISNGSNLQHIYHSSSQHFQTVHTSRGQPLAGTPSLYTTSITYPRASPILQIGSTANIQVITFRHRRACAGMVNGGFQQCTLAHVRICHVFPRMHMNSIISNIG